MISLRTSEGLNLDIIEQKWGSNTKQEIQNILETYIAKLSFNGSKVQLTNEGKLVADGIAAALFK
jgi:coproporphyrinogen III oxidase-like Fe-S oxidoreductase